MLDVVRKFAKVDDASRASLPGSVPRHAFGSVEFKPRIPSARAKAMPIRYEELQIWHAQRTQCTRSLAHNCLLTRARVVVGVPLKAKEKIATAPTVQRPPHAYANDSANAERDMRMRLRKPYFLLVL